MEQNEAYGLTSGTQQRFLLSASLEPQTDQEQSTDTTRVEDPEYEYIDVRNLPQAKFNAANRDFPIERNQSYAIVTIHQRGTDK